MNKKEILQQANIIAVIGFSDKAVRPSKGIALYLAEKGYTVYGVNPRLSGQTIEGIECFGNISDIPDNIDIVNVFRNSKYLEETVRQVAKLDSKPLAIWTQLGVMDDKAREIAEKKGIDYVENRCIYIEHRKHFDNNA